MVDVAVIGGGPAGCVAAADLAAAGWRVTVFEEHPSIGTPVDCSGIIGAEAFAALDLPVSSIVDELCRIELIAPSGGAVGFERRQPIAHIVDRRRFDQALGERAAAAGAEIVTSAQVVSVTPWSEGIELEVLHDGGSQRHSARAVVLAGGPRYRFQEQLGLGRPVRFLQTLQAEVQAVTAGPAKVFLGQRIAPGSYAWYIPVQTAQGVRAKIGVSAVAGAPAAFQRFWDRLVSLRLVAEPRPAAKGWIIPVQPLRRTYADRVVAVGDAAGQTKPTTGGGLYYGPLCARFAAQTLDEALRRDDLSARRLAGYERRWRARLGCELRTAVWFRRVIERLSDAELDALIGLFRTKDGLSRLMHRHANFDWHHRLILRACQQPRFAAAVVHGVLRSWLPV